MNLKSDQLDQLNTLLRSKDLDIPDFRRSVNQTGSNYKWLQKHILKRNPGISQELLSLLHIKGHGKQKAAQAG